VHRKKSVSHRELKLPTFRLVAYRLNHLCHTHEANSITPRAFVTIMKWPSRRPEYIYFKVYPTILPHNRNTNILLTPEVFQRISTPSLQVCCMCCRDTRRASVSQRSRLVSSPKRTASSIRGLRSQGERVNGAFLIRIAALLRIGC
jgi:hypothetical protein